MLSFSEIQEHNACIQVKPITSASYHSGCRMEGAVSVLVFNPAWDYFRHKQWWYTLSWHPHNESWQTSHLAGNVGNEQDKLTLWDQIWKKTVDILQPVSWKAFSWMITFTSGFKIYCRLLPMVLLTNGDKSASVHIMTWCRLATRHCLKQYWSSSAITNSSA